MTRPGCPGQRTQHKRQHDRGLGDPQTTVTTNAVESSPRSSAGRPLKLWPPSQPHHPYPHRNRQPGHCDPVQCACRHPLPAISQRLPSLLRPRPPLPQSHLDFPWCRQSPQSASGSRHHCRGRNAVRLHDVGGGVDVPSNVVYRGGQLFPRRRELLPIPPLRPTRVVLDTHPLGHVSLEGMRSLKIGLGESRGAPMTRDGAFVVNVEPRRAQPQRVHAVAVLVALRAILLGGYNQL